MVSGETIIKLVTLGAILLNVSCMIMMWGVANDIYSHDMLRGICIILLIFTVIFADLAAWLIRSIERIIMGALEDEA
jgi:NADH:ubiquinone oxidoreductase subunit 6 (subunit J)